MPARAPPGPPAPGALMPTACPAVAPLTCAQRAAAPGSAAWSGAAAPCPAQDPRRARSRWTRRRPTPSRCSGPRGWGPAAPSGPSPGRLRARGRRPCRAGGRGSARPLRAARRAHGERALRPPRAARPRAPLPGAGEAASAPGSADSRGRRTPHSWPGLCLPARRRARPLGRTAALAPTAPSAGLRLASPAGRPGGGADEGTAPGSEASLPGWG